VDNSAVAPQGAPAYPDPTPRRSPLIRATIPASAQMQPDQQRQFFTSGVPQVRNSPPSTTANPTINAQSASVTKRITDPLIATVAQNSTDVSTALQSTMLGPWQPTVNYLPNNQVTRSGNVYLALQTNIGSQPPSSNWLLLGPQNFDVLVDGVVNIKPVQYQAATVSVPNANFEAAGSTAQPVPGWFGSTATVSLYTAAPFSGTQSLQVNAQAQFGGGFSAQKWAVSPGDGFYVSAAMKSDGTSQPRFSVIFFDASGSFVGGVTAAHGTSTSWSVSTASGVAPAGTVGMHLDCDNAATSGAGVAYFDNLVVDKIISLDNNVSDGVLFGRVNQSGLTSGSIDPSKTGVLAKGSTPSSLTSGFTYTSTTTSVTISWSGLTIYRADGTTTAITNSSVLITGLTASTTYRIYPYFDDTVSALSFVTGGVGSPAICQTAGSNTISQAQNLQSRVPLSASSGFTVATPASGSSGGSGGGSGNCLHESMLIETNRGIVKSIDSEIGDLIRCEHGWETIEAKKVMPAEIWVCVQLTDDSEIIVTPSHPFTLPAGSDSAMKRAADLSLADFLITTKGVGTIKKIEVLEMKGQKVSITTGGPSHAFFAGKDSPSILAHNFLPS
jgi:hypothetical protein